MAGFPTELASELEIWMPDRAGDARLENTLIALQERGVVAARGLTPELTWSLGVVAHQSHIVEFCGDEPERFGTENRSKEWQRQGGEFFSLHEVDGHEDKALTDRDLATVQEADLKVIGYGFSRPEVPLVAGFDRVPGADITVAYRMTELGRDRKLSELFAQFVVGATLARHEEIDPETIWLKTWESNPRVTRPCRRTGFTQVLRTFAMRSTLQEVGVRINGKEVKIDPDNPDRHTVIDPLLFMRYDPGRHYNYRGERVL
jgi:hypothetical protein